MLRKAVRLRAAAVALLSPLVALPSFAADVTELFISEYVKGTIPTNFSKAIEIYNGTDVPVDLAAGNYRLVIYFNGNLIKGSNIALEGVVEPGDVYVVAKDRAAQEILDETDLPSNQNFFTGNDSVLLMRDGAVVDAIGQLGVDPGEQWPGDVGTRDRTLRRRPEICRGDVFLDDPYFASSGEWEELPVNTFDGLGRHELSAGCESCPTTADLSCEMPIVVGSNADPGRTRSYDRYGCLSSSYGGTEILYAFTAPADGRYRLRLDDLTADLDLVVLGPGDCRANLCADSSDASGIGPEVVSFDARAGERYFVAVDGVAGAVSSYMLELICPVAPSASFTLLPEFPTEDDAVRFLDASTGDPTTWRWDLGDGTEATGRSPSHKYANPDTYTVTLTVENASGSSSAMRTVTVSPSQSTIAVTGPTAGEVDEVLTFTAVATGCQPDPEGWEWTVAGGEIVSGGTTEAVRLRWPAGGLKAIDAVNSACGGASGSRSVRIAQRQAAVSPAAPSSLAAAALSSTDVRLAWTDNAGTEDGYVIERREADGSFSEVDLLPANTTSAALSLAGDINPTTTSATFRVKAFNAAGSSSPSNAAEAVTTPESCDPERSLCLLDKRFKVEATWRDFAGRRGLGHPVSVTTDTGYFWFFDADNVELVVKVIDGRSLTNRFWVYYGSLSNVEFSFTVTDTETGNVKTYVNPPGEFASLGDVNALPAGPDSLTFFRLPASEALRPPAAPKGDLGVDVGWSPDPPVAGREVLFEVVSRPPRNFAEHTWSFGDGPDRFPTRERTIAHTFREEGTYDVTLEVVDKSGSFPVTETTARRVQVRPNKEPEVFVHGPETAPPGVPVTFSASANPYCVPLRSEGWEWEVSGGAVRGATTGSTIDVSWTETGPKTIVVRNAGCSTVFARIGVRVEHKPILPVCEPSRTELCLQDNRVRVTVRWTDFQGMKGNGIAVRMSNETGRFWYFNEANVELVLKVLDGRCINGRFWVFYGALSNVEFRIEVMDMETGNVKIYRNPPGQFASVGDVLALPGECPD